MIIQRCTIYINNPEEYIFEMIKLIHTIREIIGHDSIVVATITTNLKTKLLFTKAWL